MSFASEVREELCRVLPEKRCCRMAECYGILMYCNTFSKNEIKIITESRQFAELLPRLFRRAFGLDFDQFPSLEQPGKMTFVIDDPEKLEEIANSFEGVDKTYAIQSGREVRIMVKPEEVTEDNMIILAREIAKKIENELEYPGQIKVNLIRETKAVEYAK